MRSFIAIAIPTEVRSAIAELQADLLRAGADVAWTTPDNIHLTLKFLGEIDKKLADEVERICRETALEFSSFSLRIGNAGVFPTPRHPRVLWVGLNGETETLESIQERLDQKLTSLGLEPEEKDFRPHLTIGRVKSNRNARELLDRASVFTLPDLSFRVTEIVLMKSDLHPAGAQYTELSKAGLKP